MEFNFKDPQVELPEEGKHVLVKYYKGNKASWRSEKGVFYTEGYIVINGGTVIWNDYADRSITYIENGFTKSKNRIIKWAYIEEEEF